MKITTENTTFEHLCQIAFYHAGEVFTMKSGSKHGSSLSFGDVTVSIEAECQPANEGCEPIWDMITVNGYSGNRHTGRDMVAKLYAPIIAAAAVAFHAKAARTSA